MEVRHSPVTFGAPDLRAPPVHADHSERIHFVHRSREQGAFCRNALYPIYGPISLYYIQTYSERSERRRGASTFGESLIRVTYQ